MLRMARRVRHKITSPLDIELTKEWDQLIAEVWVGVSTGRMPALPEPVILGENDEGVIDGDVDPLEMEAAADRSTTDVRELSSTKQVRSQVWTATSF